MSETVRGAAPVNNKKPCLSGGAFFMPGALRQLASAALFPWKFMKNSPTQLNFPYIRKSFVYNPENNELTYLISPLQL